MKRFFSVIFVLLLLLCQDVGAGQAQVDTSGETNEQIESTPPIVEGEQATGNKPEQHQERTDVKNPEIVGEKDLPMVESLKKLAAKTNWAFFLSLCSVLIALFSWRTGRESVDVTREIGEKQSCAYIRMKDVRVGHNEAYAICEITIENVGNSPCVKGSITAKIKSENTLVPTFVETNEIRDFYSEDDTRQFGIIQTGHTHTVSLHWFGGHYDTPDAWFDLFLSDIGADSRVIFEVQWEDVFGKQHTSNFDAHKHHGKGINWNDLRIWSEGLKINPQQEYKREK